MKEPVPKGIVQSAEQSTKELHEEISGSLNKAGFDATPQSVNSEDNSPLKAIKEKWGDTVHIVGSTYDEQIGGTGDTARIRTAEGKVPTAIDAVRRLKQKFMKKAA